MYYDDGDATEAITMMDVVYEEDSEDDYIECLHLTGIFINCPVQM